MPVLSGEVPDRRMISECQVADISAAKQLTLKAHRRFFDKLGIQLGYKRMNDWYNVTTEDIGNNGVGRFPRREYNNSPSLALQKVYPEHKWELERFKHRPKKLWKNQENHKNFFDRLFAHLGYSEMEDWYNVTQKDVYSMGGWGPLESYNNSPSTALTNLYPEHNWMLWKFSDARREGINLFSVWLGVQLGIKELNNWNNITWRDIYQYGGLLNYPNNLIAEAIKDAYPQHQWHSSTFPHLSGDYWNDIGNKKEYFYWLGFQLGYSTMDDWYQATKGEVEKITGQGSFNFLDAIPKILEAVYPEHNWIFRKFTDVPTGEVTTKLEWLSGKLSIRCLDDWYRVSMEQVNKWMHVGSTKNLVTMLQTGYPQHQWDTNQFGNPIKSSQWEVLRAIQQLFPTHSI